jgi:hypothetical protein
MSQSLEARRSRASFTKTLSGLCSRLDDRATFEVEDRYASKYLGGVQTSAGRITALFVAGSYARGASTCGDLDIVLTIEITQGRLLGAAPYARSVFGPRPDVRYYVGTPDANTSGVAFPEGALIWRAGDDWRATLAAIKENPNAERFARTDQVPLRVEQLNLSVEERETLTQQEQAGLLSWRMLPYEDIAAPARDLSELQNRIRKFCIRACGAKTQELLPPLLTYFADRSAHPKERFEEMGGAGFRTSGVLVGFGRSSADIGELDEGYTSRVIHLPHRSRRGPNALWEITRGDQHPLVQAFADRELWCFGEVGEPEYLEHVGEYQNALVLESFASEEAALQYQADLIEEGMGESFYTGAPVRLHGRALLDALGEVDVLELDSAMGVAVYYLTREGARILEEPDEELTSSLGLAALLPKAAA